jgi:hypothetical protein
MKRVLQIALACLIAAFPLKIIAQTKALSIQKTTKSNVEMSITNTGIFGLDPLSMVGTNYWPRGTKNSYVFGGGIWFAAQKNIPGKGRTKIIDMSYDSNLGMSWMTPGRVEDGFKIDTSKNLKYQLQIASKYNSSGSPLTPGAPVWAMWKTDNSAMGSYIYAPAMRNNIIYPKGAAFFSDEDIIGVFKDTDTLTYKQNAPGSGRDFKDYPMGIQYEQALYSWAVGTPLQDVVALRYTMINTSPDTLHECWFAPVIDSDIIPAGNYSGGSNDRARYYNEDDSLQLGVQWSGEDNGDGGKDLGYFAMSLIETPVVDAAGFVQSGNSSGKMLGAVSFRLWDVSTDPITPEQHYDFMINSYIKQGDIGPGDQRMLMATGPFSMKPGDTTHITFAMIYANPSGSKIADGTTGNLAEVVSKAKTVRAKFLLQPTSVQTENLLKEKPAFISFKNDAATLHFKNESFKNIRAELFNTLGERMMTIHNGDIAASEVSFKTNELSAGMYYCVIILNGERITLPLTIVR